MFRKHSTAARIRNEEKAENRATRECSRFHEQPPEEVEIVACGIEYLEEAIQVLMESYPEASLECHLEHMRRELDMRIPLFEMLIARRGALVLASALIVHRYSTSSGRRVFLKAFAVRDGHRRQGIGTQLMEAIAQGAMKYSAEAMEWQLSPSNIAGIAFSEKIGGACEPIDQWLDCEWVCPRPQ